MIGDLEHAWYFDFGSCSALPYLLVVYFTITWYIWPNGSRSSTVCVSCLLSVVTYLGSKEDTSMMNVSWGSWARMLGESLVLSHMGLESLMRSL